MPESRKQDPRSVGEFHFHAVGAVQALDAPPQKRWEVGLEPVYRFQFYIVRQVKIRALRPEFAAHSLEQRAQLLRQRSAPDGDHFRDEQAGEDAVFFRDVAADRQSRAFFSADRDLVLLNEFADVLESHGSLNHGRAVMLSDRVHQVRSGHAARRGHFPSARFDEVIVKQAEDVIRLHPRPVGIEDAEAVGVAVGCKSHRRFFREHGFAQGLQIFVGDVRPRAVEEHVPIRAQSLHIDAMRREGPIQVSGAASVQRVGHDAQFRIAKRFEIHELREAIEIEISRIDFLKWLVVRLGGGSLAEFGGARFDIVRDFGKRRSAVGAGEFQALIFGGIVAGRKIDGPVHLAPQDFVGDHGRRRRPVAQQHVDAVLAKNFRGRAREFLGEEEANNRK